MSFIGRIFTSPGEGGRGDPWPERSYVATEALRDWWVVDCWFHKRPETAASHFDGFVKWVTERPPDSIPYLSWAPYTKLRIDLTCLKTGPTPEVEKRYRNIRGRFYALSFCYARNEHADIEQYQSVWHQSPEYEAFAQMAEDPKTGWPKEAVHVTPDWYHEMIVKTAGSRWVGYHGFEERRMADLG
jgi:hypothetical protein